VTAEVALREAEYAAVERELLTTVRSLHAGADAARRSLDEYRDHLLPQSVEAYRIALSLRDAGEASYLEVLAAQSTLTDTRIDYVETIHEAERLRLELRYASGEEIR
jgi:outer membrane protein TolC